MTERRKTRHPRIPTSHPSRMAWPMQWTKEQKRGALPLIQSMMGQQLSRWTRAFCPKEETCHSPMQTMALLS
ncbi:MAG: hypothetical protein OK454_06625, partial [Thaumarchaeota archaeon]|nr:hypothetical protein [Nitrososphaerota archaeon]